MRKVLEPFQYNVESKQNSRRQEKTIRCTQKVQPTKNVSTGKKRRSTNTPQPLHHMPESSQQSRSSKQKGKKSTTQTPHDSEKPVIARSSNDKR